MTVCTIKTLQDTEDYLRVLLSTNLVLLQDAVRGDHREVGRLLMEHGAKVMDRDGALVDLSDSHMSLNISLLGALEPDWEIDPADITFMSIIGIQSATAYLCLQQQIERKVPPFEIGRAHV